MTNEKLLFNYYNQVSYNLTSSNIVGATIHTTLRELTATANTTNCAYVQKFGSAYEITGVSNATLAATLSTTGNGWQWEFYGASTGTYFGYLTDSDGVWSYTSSATVGSAEQLITSLKWIKGNATALATTNTITLTTNVDVGGYAFYYSRETLNTTQQATITFYNSNTGSTYYESSMMYGGKRHTPAIGNTRKPYFHPVNAEAALNTTAYIIQIQDFQYYQIDEFAINAVTSPNNLVFQTALGQIPKLISIIGISQYRDVENDGNNQDTIYVSSTGLNTTNDGTYQSPYGDPWYANSNLNGRSNINIIDSAIYLYATPVSVQLTTSVTLEPIYGKTPTLKTNKSINVFFEYRDNPTISGIKFDGNGLTTVGCLQVDDATKDSAAKIRNNEFTNATGASDFHYAITHTSNKFETIIERNYFHTNDRGGIYIFNDTAGGVGYIKKNIIANNQASGIKIYPNANACTDFDIKNNIIYNNAYTEPTAVKTGGIVFLGGAGRTFPGNIENNVIINNYYYGIELYNEATVTGSIKDNVIVGNGTLDVESTVTANTITYCFYETLGANVTAGAGCFATDPELCSDASGDYKLGISSLSDGYNSDSGNNNIGIDFSMINIGVSNIKFNNITFEANNQYASVITKKTTSDYTGLELKWCTVKSSQGIAIHLYENDTNLNSVFQNCKIYDNGQGVALDYGGNSFDECLFYKNRAVGIYANYLQNSFDHITCHLSRYGFYFGVNSVIVDITNSIFNENSVYGIYSDTLIDITYCCITDAVNSNVDTGSATNITDNPLFINTTDGSEDYHLKSIANGYNYDSACLGRGSDDNDLGCYLVQRTISESWWKSYQLEYNPRNLEWKYKYKGLRNFENILGTQRPWAKATKRQYKLTFPSDQYSTEELRQKIEHLQMLTKAGDNDLIESQTYIRMSPLPTQGVMYSTSATIDSSEKTLVDADATWIENQWKGFHVGIKFASGSLTATINTTNNTLKVNPSPSWTTSAWVGYEWFDSASMNFYYITSNSADTLTLSDPDGNLTTQTGISWAIEKYFKIENNQITTLTLTDDDSELISGTYDYITRFIEVKNIPSDLSYGQPRYYWQKETWKSGFELGLEEI